MNPEDFNVPGKVVSFDERFEIDHYGLRCLMRKSPEAVVITRSGKPVAVLVNEERRASWRAGADDIRCPAALIEHWMQEVHGSLFPFPDMAIENRRPVSFDLGEAVGRVMLCPVGDEAAIDLEHAIRVEPADRLAFKYYLAKDYLTEEIDIPRDLTFAEYRDRMESAMFNY